MSMSSQNLPDLKPGDVVAGRFRVIKMVGAGGFSVVYRAHQEELNRFVALKVLKPRAASDSRVVERFRREALFASHLTHPNTIRLHDYGETQDNLFYIAMEFLEGMDLSAVVQRGEPMDLKRVWRVLVQACRSLTEAHRLNLIHRDLKPENIFLVQRPSGEELIKVLDFGVSKALSPIGNAGPATMAPLTQEGTVFGTPLYMAPEQAMAEDITPAVDVYALGHITFEMITGRAAYWDCTNPMDVMLRQVNDPPLALPRPWHSTPFSRLITKCTQKNPRRRIPSAGKLLERLMDEAFEPYMDPRERPVTTRSIPAVTTMSGPIPTGALQINEIYRQEYARFEAALSEARAQRQPRLLVVRGKPGSGRSTLMRAFVDHARGMAHAAVIHRQSAGGTIPPSAGLEADVAIASGLDLQTTGFDELKRLVSAMYDDAGQRLDEQTGLEVDAGSLDRLVSMRDTFLSRVSAPFRERAEAGVLVWAVENLERMDSLTVAFLDRFWRELQARPAPVVILVTISPDELSRRPGVARYAERVLAAQGPWATQLVLGRDFGVEQTPEGPRTKPLDLREINLADVYEQTRQAAGKPSSPKTLPIAVGDILEDVDDATALTEPPQAPPAPTPAPPAAPRPGADPSPFDRVLGYLAQLGDEVPRALWEAAQADIFSEHEQRVGGMILEQAERFGLVQLTDDTIYFPNPAYMQLLRDAFEQTPDANAAHVILARHLQSFYPQPTREQLRLIISHLERSGAFNEAVQVLLRAGQQAFTALDFDGAREHYMLIQQLVDHLVPAYAAREGVTPTIELERPKLWLRLGEIHSTLREHGAAEDALRRAISEVGDGDAALRGRAYKLLGELKASQSQFVEALRHYESAQRAFRSAGMARAFVAVTADMGHAMMMQGQLAAAEEFIQHALDNATKLRDDLLLARASLFMGQAMTRRLAFGEALEHLERARGLFEALRRDGDVATCFKELGDACFASARFEEAQVNYASALARSHMSRFDQARTARIGLAQALCATGAVVEATHHLRTALGGADPAREPQDVAQLHLYLGDALLIQDDFDTAREHYAQAAQLAEDIGQTRLWMDALVRAAYVDFDAQQTDRCYEALAQAAELAQSLGDRDAELQVRTHIIYFQLVEHDLSVRGDTFSSLLHMGRRMKLRRTELLCWLFRADVNAARGEVEQAREELREAYTLAARMGDYALFIAIARRDRHLQRRLGLSAPPEPADGYALGALTPPEIGHRRALVLR